VCGDAACAGLNLPGYSEPHVFDKMFTEVKHMEDILVVDDDSNMLCAIKRILEREGFVAHCVESGEEAIEQIKERTFSLMITDYNMPGLNGLELASKGLELAPRMPIIMNTGGLTPVIICLAKEIGIAKVLSKPFLMSELMKTIRDVMVTPGKWATSTG
jgi:DNA-binding NtrC family response regulator